MNQASIRKQWGIVYLIFNFHVLFPIGSLSICTYHFLFVVCDVCVTHLISLDLVSQINSTRDVHICQQLAKNKVVLSKLGTLITKWESKSCICTVYVTAPICLCWYARIQQIPRVT